MLYVFIWLLKTYLIYSNCLLYFIYFDRLSGSGVVTLHIGSIPTSVYCLVGDVECGNGTWTLVMMVADGSKVFIPLLFIFLFLAWVTRTDFLKKMFYCLCIFKVFKLYFWRS